MANISLPRAYTGKYPAARLSSRENRVVETAKNTILAGTDVTFEVAPICAALDGAGAADGTDAVTNLMLQDGVMFEYRNIATATILSPVWASTGLNIARDLTDNDGIEITQGITSRAKHAYTVGTDEGVFFEVTMKLTDVSGTDDCAIGWRKAEAYQAAVDNYDEMAAFNIISGDIKIETILNNAATVTTDTTDNWADTESKTLRVEVLKDGTVKFYVDGVEPTVPAPFTFDAGEVIVPFLYMIHAADVAESTLLTSWKCGLIGRL
jgi:hypothetical protein